MVAIQTYEVFRLRDGKYRALCDSPEEFRRAFQLHAKTRIVLLGTATDSALEKYWAYRRRDDAPRQIAKLNVECAIGPNFSFFLDAPRTDVLFNRKRQLLCLSELADAGINTVPHLNAVMPGDWEIWRQYLSRSDSVRFVAKEFQTGCKNRVEGVKAIECLARLQDQLGRELHPLAISGGQFTEEIATRFRTFSIIDSRPFMNAVFRQRAKIFAKGLKWIKDPTLPGIGVDEHIKANISAYASWVKARANRRFDPKSGNQQITHREAS